MRRRPAETWADAKSARAADAVAAAAAVVVLAAIAVVAYVYWDVPIGP